MEALEEEVKVLEEEVREMGTRVEEMRLHGPSRLRALLDDYFVKLRPPAVRATAPPDNNGGDEGRMAEEIERLHARLEAALDELPALNERVNRCTKDLVSKRSMLKDGKRHAALFHSLLEQDPTAD